VSPYKIAIANPSPPTDNILSYDVCLQAKGEIIRTGIVYSTCAHLDEQFLQLSGLDFVTLGLFHCAYI